jgi:hypothetical protein
MYGFGICQRVFSSNAFSEEGGAIGLSYFKEKRFTTDREI